MSLDVIIRVSKMGDRTESSESTLTIDDQRGLANGAVKAVGERVGKEFLALDQSGFSFLHSKELQAALDRVRSGKSDGIAVAYGDRIMRNWWRLGIFFEELEKAGGRFVVSGMEHIDYRDPIGRQIFGGMAQASEQVYFAAKRRGDSIADAVIANGVPNRVPYGYQRNIDPETGEKRDAERHSKALVVDPITGPVVSRVFAMREAGHPYADVVRALNGEGIPAPRGGVWTKSSVTQIIKCETYVGDVILGERRKADAHPALVSRSAWKAVQQSIRKVKRNGRLVAGLAGGLLDCCNCGRPLSVIGTGPRDDRRMVYGCRGESAAGRCSRPIYVSKRIADEYVEQVIVAALNGSELEVVSSTRELDAARRELAAAKDELAAFVTAASALEADLFAQGIAARQERVSAAQEAFETLADHAELVDDVPEASAWSTLDLEGQRHVARLLIDSIVISPARSRRPVDTSSPDRFDLRWKHTRN